MIETIALYARVSTKDQDITRQYREMDDYVEQNYPDAHTTKYGDIISGAIKGGGEDLQDLIADINDDQYDLVIINEISRIDRGGVSISSFIEDCLENDCGVVAQDIGLEIAVDDEELMQIIYTMIAEVVGKIAKIEHRQKINRIVSGIQNVQENGTWTGSAPSGFYVDKKTDGGDGALHVDLDEFLAYRAALQRIDDGESKNQVAKDDGFDRRTLGNLYNDRRSLYLEGRADAVYDEDHKVRQIRAAMEEVGLLPSQNQ